MCDFHRDFKVIDNIYYNTKLMEVLYGRSFCRIYKG